MFRLIKKRVYWIIVSSKPLSSIANTPNHVKCISLNNQQCMTPPSKFYI